jgi:hypothetical protein
MKCPACNTNVIKIPVNWKCPQCGEKLPEPGKWFQFWEGTIEFISEKGVLFWSIWFAVFLLFLGIFELVFGDGYLLNYLTGSMLMSLIGIFFTGMLIDMVVKINLPLRVAFGTEFILRERKAIRNFRKATNIALVIGLLVSLIWLKPVSFFLHFPAYSVVIAWFLALAWSIIGLFLDVKLMEDVRFRYFMERLGIIGLKRYRRIGTIMVGSLVVTAILFNILIRIHGIWLKIADLGFVGSVIRFTKSYLSWLF